MQKTNVKEGNQYKYIGWIKGIITGNLKVALSKYTDETNINTNKSFIQKKTQIIKYWIQNQKNVIWPQNEKTRTLSNENNIFRMHLEDNKHRKLKYTFLWLLKIHDISVMF